ncbi:MAG: EamA family transporter [Rhodospirillaceae bacterium]|nr:EamA family transporter [Rhodospirillaceae bacterium]
MPSDPAAGDARPSALRIALMTAFAITAFASNSIICRAALGPGLIDPATFTSVRLVSAAVVLAVVVFARRRHLPHLAVGDWRAAAALFTYAVFFSFGYVLLPTGSGALILFGAVQLTMFAWAFHEGERFTHGAWFGLGLAVAGLVWLVLPGLTAPDPLGALLHTVSGAAWGVFSLLIRSAKHPVESNAANFAICVPLTLILSALFWGDMDAQTSGLALAVLSGGLASGCGYVIWYWVLRHVPAARASATQLSAPAVAALGGVVLLGEDLTLRLIVASAAMLGGVALVLAQKAKART